MVRIARFVYQGITQYGLLEDGEMLRLIEGDVLGEWQPSEATAPLAAVQLLAPVAPPNIIAIGLNYRRHAEESGHPIPTRPVIFLKATTSLCHPEQPILLPRMAPGEVDYECELAIVIGKRAKHVPAAHALDYVLGYTCANDVSARDVQNREDTQWARAKSFDTFSPLGPWIETELAPVDVLVQTRVNHEMRQMASTREMMFSVGHLIAFISSIMTLQPGDLILTGTPAGIGPLVKGDTVEVTVEVVGSLSNPVVESSGVVR